jgi:hypothetical protein
MTKWHFAEVSNWPDESGRLGLISFPGPEFGPLGANADPGKSAWGDGGKSFPGEGGAPYEIFLV